MADLTALADVSHVWGSDIGLSGSGDLARSLRVQRSRERVLRRLLTNPEDYVFHPTYGAGLRRYVGELVDTREVAGVVRTQMRQEKSVAQMPAPQVTVTAVPNGLKLSISYVALPDRQPTALTFEVTD